MFRSYNSLKPIQQNFKPKLNFLVLEEIHNNVSFMSKGTWIFMIFFIALGLLWTFIGLIVALLNTLIEEVSTIVGPEGFYLWSSLSCKLISTNILIQP